MLNARTEAIFSLPENASKSMVLGCGSSAVSRSKTISAPGSPARMALPVP